VSDYKINNRVLLGLQIAGLGRKEAEIIPGILNLSNGFIKKRCTDLQNKLGVSIIGLSNEILGENLEAGGAARIARRLFKKYKVFIEE
jgi:hypothetical protein